jgi:hypothetical protein
MIASAILVLVLCPTPLARLTDAQQRPYFLWDCDVTMPQLRDYLASDDLEQRAYWVAKLMRQAKPDDALVIIGAGEIRRLWPRIAPTLGRMRAFWTWYLDWAR